MIDALRPTTSLSPDRHVAPSATAVRAGAPTSPASRDGVTLSTTARPGLRPVPAAVADRLHQVGNLVHPANDTAAPMTIEHVLNPLDETSVVGQYVNGLAELSGTPRKTATWLWAVGKDLHDPTLSATERVVRLREHTQATAKLLYTATALPAAWTGATAVLPTWLSGGHFAAQVSQCHRILTGVMNVARPIADTALFAGDAVYLKARLQDPQATKGQVARAIVDVSLDTARLAAYMTKNPTVKLVASAALWARTGLGVYDVWQHAHRT